MRRRVPGLGSAPDQLPSSEAYASVVHRGGKLYMAPVTLQFWGADANRYYEYSGFPHAQDVDGRDQRHTSGLGGDHHLE